MSFQGREAKEFEALLEEFVRRHLAKEAPDPVDYVRRAGSGAQRLREAIAVFLAESEPVAPEPEVATELADRYGSDARPHVHEDRPERRQPFTRLLREWMEASVEHRCQLLDGLAEQAFALRLGTEELRAGGHDECGSPTCVIPLAHRQGARAEVGADRVLWITVYGLPSELTGSRPLVAFPRTSPEKTDLEWSGTEHGLPPGWARCDEVKPRGELRAEVGRVSQETDLCEILSEIRLLALPWEGS